jgi:hypothetical protein
LSALKDRGNIGKNANSNLTTYIYGSTSPLEKSLPTVEVNGKNLEPSLVLEKIDII